MTITRFAPSPTGMLHLGGARTALFNWLYARHHGGLFKLRIEDTDKERSTPEATKAILDGLAWLGLDHDGEIVYQSKQAAWHAEIAHYMLERGYAYRCFCTPEELAAMRGPKGFGKYDRRWRPRNPRRPPDIMPNGTPYTIRIMAPLEGELTINDLVQGTVKIPATQLDDYILLRSDGTPTYMLAVVVDDHDMGVTHVIRGVDHLNNAFRQSLIYQAMGWPEPQYAHIPLIHGADGAKMSKRHGATGVQEYIDMGFRPDAMRNYLLRLGWGKGDIDLIDTPEAIKIFDLADVRRSAARFDMKKLESVNRHYTKAAIV